MASAGCRRSSNLQDSESPNKRVQRKILILLYIFYSFARVLAQSERLEEPLSLEVSPKEQRLPNSFFGTAYSEQRLRRSLYKLQTGELSELNSSLIHSTKFKPQCLVLQFGSRVLVGSFGREFWSRVLVESFCWKFSLKIQTNFG